MTAELVGKALQMALRHGRVRPNAVIHTDCGSLVGFRMFIADCLKLTAYAKV